MAFEEEVRIALSEWTEESDNKEALDNTSGARELLNILLDPNNSKLLSAIIDRTSTLGIPNEDGIKDDMIKIFEMGQESPDGLNNLIKAYEKNPDNIAELLKNGKFSDIASITTTTNKDYADNTQDSNREDLLNIETIALEISDNSSDITVKNAAALVLNDTHNAISGHVDNQEFAKNIANLANTIEYDHPNAFDTLNSYVDEISPINAELTNAQNAITQLPNDMINTPPPQPIN